LRRLPQYLSRHEKLMKDFNENFARRGAAKVLRHEKSHFSRESKIAIEKLKSFLDIFSIDLFSEHEEIRKKLEQIGEEKSIMFRRALERKRENMWEGQEIQTEVYHWVKNFKNKKKFIEDCATFRV